MRQWKNEEIMQRVRMRQWENAEIMQRVTMKQLVNAGNAKVLVEAMGKCRGNAKG
jgi:hypothetical protein